MAGSTKESTRRRVSADLAATRRRIDRWRTSRKAGKAMPETLWSEAVRLVERHGLYRVARSLGLNYDNLKKRALAAGKRRERDVRFVELEAGLADFLAGPTGAVVELEDGAGAKLVIRARSGEGVDVLGLAEAFWSRQA